MPRPLIAAALVAVALAGCKKPGPAEPSEADAKEAYVEYKRLAAESRAAKQQMDKCMSLKVDAELMARKNVASPPPAGAEQVEKDANDLAEKAFQEYSAVQERARAMEAKWERAWARLGYSLEPLH